MFTVILQNDNIVRLILTVSDRGDQAREEQYVV